MTTVSPASRLVAPVVRDRVPHPLPEAFVGASVLLVGLQTPVSWATGSFLAFIGGVGMLLLGRFSLSSSNLWPLLILPWCVYALVDSSGNGARPTLVLVASAAMFVIALSTRSISPASLHGMLWICLGLSAAVLFAEFVTVNVLGMTQDRHFWGDRAVLGPGGVIYTPQPRSPFDRVSGLFPEPSVAGWSHIALLAAFLRAGFARRTWFAGISVLAVLATGSLSGVIGLSGVVIAAFLEAPERRQAVTSTRAVRMVVLVAAVAAVSFYLLSLTGRLSEFTESGTSGYSRLVAPARLAVDALRERPLGIPLGDTSWIETKAYFLDSNFEGGSTTEVHNSLLRLPVQFGWAGAAALVVFMRRLSSLIFEADGVVVVAAFFVLASTGALISPLTLPALSTLVLASRVGSRSH